MATKGKLLTDYTSQEWIRYRRRLVKPDLVYWISILSLVFFLLLSGFGRIPTEEYRLDGILRIGGGIILLILLIAYMIRKINRRNNK
jgi:hypothetical protein